MKEYELNGWIPFYLQRGRVNWGYMGRQRFVEPFFQDTVQKLINRHPFNRLFRRDTGLEILQERLLSHPGLPLRGIVFHLSRCGSTLVAQSLAALPESVVLSEPAPIDTLLQWLSENSSFNPETGSALLRGLVSALGQPRRVEDQNLYIKADAWHICHLDRILSAFPGVPWIFLYRDPIEVLVSQMRMPGIFTVPGWLTGHGLIPPEHLMPGLAEHTAWVLGILMRAAAEAIGRHPGGLPVNYSELPGGIATRISNHFKLALGPAENELLRTAALRDAKSPHQSFHSDSSGKQAEVTDEIREVAARWLNDVYKQLEYLRLTEAYKA